MRIALAVGLTLLLAVPALAQELQGTLRKIKDSGTITIGYREQSVPFSFLDRDGKPAGYTIELCTRVVTGVQQQLGLPKLDVKWVAVTPETRIPAIVQGTIDLECGSTTNTLSRQEQVDFSHMTFVDGSTLLVKKGSGVTGLADVGGKRIAVIPGTTTEQVVRDALQKAFLSTQIVTVKEHREGLAALESGAVDAYVSDRVILLGLAVTHALPEWADRAKDSQRHDEIAVERGHRGHPRGGMPLGGSIAPRLPDRHLVARRGDRRARGPRTSGVYPHLRRRPANRWPGRLQPLLRGVRAG
jgi:glutamate/aspartate transport system substrate-binding protein